MTSPLDVPSVPTGKLYEYLGIAPQTLMRFRDHLGRERPGSGGGKVARHLTIREVHQLFVFLTITRDDYQMSRPTSGSVTSTRWMWGPAMDALDEGVGVGYLVTFADDRSHHWFPNLDYATQYAADATRGFHMTAIVSLELPDDFQEWLAGWIQGN